MLQQHQAFFHGKLLQLLFYGSDIFSNQTELQFRLFTLFGLLIPMPRPITSIAIIITITCGISAIIIFIDFTWKLLLQLSFGVSILSGGSTPTLLVFSEYVLYGSLLTRSLSSLNQVSRSLTCWASTTRTTPSPSGSTSAWSGWSPGSTSARRCGARARGSGTRSCQVSNCTMWFVKFEAKKSKLTGESLPDTPVFTS